MKVLVVEDELGVGMVLRDFLLDLGHDPVLARSAEAALGALERAPFDAILLDLALPGMSGLDFLRLRRVRESGVPVVGTSGVATEAQARECLRLGAVDFVAKPVTFDRLQIVLAAVEHGVFRPPRPDPPRVERRRAPRVPLAVPVHVVDYAGGPWETTSINLNPSGIKIRLVPDRRPADATKLVFTPDGGELIKVTSLLVRQDHDGYALYFVNLADLAAQRLSVLRGELRSPALARSF